MLRRIALWLILATFVALTLSGQMAAAADAYKPFSGVKSTWHDGFDRFDYLMDDETLAIRPDQRGEGEGFGIKEPPLGKHRCVVIVPREPAPGHPWSWRGCYWDHEPQAEVALLGRGFHVAHISASANLKPGKTWDAWYAFLTREHGLSKKPAFIGMSRGGEYAYTWATAHPESVACIYADNPAITPEAIGKLGDLARTDVPLLHICGEIDPLLPRHSATVEAIYRQLGGRISVMIKEGAGHHPHSLHNPSPIADFMAQAVQKSAPVAPTWVGPKYVRTSFYAPAGSYRDFPREGRAITCRGPAFEPCYDRYAFTVGGVDGTITIVVPTTPAPGKPWIFRADFADAASAIDLGLVASGFHIVTGPVPFNADGPSREHWDTVYKWLTAHGFSRKPALAGVGGAAGEAYAWAIANPEKVSCVYGVNPVLRSTMTKVQPMENLEKLAKAGVPLVHYVTSRDPKIENQTRSVKVRYQSFGGTFTVFGPPGADPDPARVKGANAVVDLILKQQAR
jgi:pimeloyl-ACP methyl ester carboxylesterase